MNKEQVINLLKGNPDLFNFFEALYLLETMGIKKITLRGHLSFQHADHPIQSLSIKNHEEVDLEVNCYRLAPDVILDHYTDKAVKEKRQGNTALMDFIHLFDHRLINLFYETHKKLRPWLCQTAYVKNFIRSVSGLNNPSLYFFSGIFSEPIRSIDGLEHLINYYFKVSVKIIPFIKNIYLLKKQELHSLGKNFRLSTTALLGKKIITHSDYFEIQIVEISYSQYLIFHPKKSYLRLLIEIIEAYALPPLKFYITFKVMEEEKIPCVIGLSELGWNSWLK